jgi:hypothetical protein
MVLSRRVLSVQAGVEKGFLGLLPVDVVAIQGYNIGLPDGAALDTLLSRVWD